MSSDTLAGVNITETSVTVTPAPSSRRRQVLRVLGWDAAVIAVLVIVLELLFQRFLPEYRGHYYDHSHTGSYPVAMNEMGFRGPAVATTKAPGELRMLALGDSVTFGTGQPVENTWPLVLAERLTTGASRPTTAMNAAVPGSTVRQMTYAYEHRWEAWKPDVVVLMATANMVSLGWHERDREPAMPPLANTAPPDPRGPLTPYTLGAKRVLSVFCLPRVLNINSQRALYVIGLLRHDVDPAVPVGPMPAFGLQQVGLDPRIGEHAWEQFAADVRALRDAVASRGGRLIVGFSPTRFATWNTWRDNEKRVPLDRLTLDATVECRDLATALHVSYVPGRDALRNQRRRIAEHERRFAPLFIQFDYNHLDRDGHRALADAVAAELAADGK